MTKRQVIALLRGRVKQAGSQAAFSRKTRISLPYLNDVLNGRREPGPRILRALKLRRETRFVSPAA